MTYTKVVIIGGGFGGLNVAKSLNKVKAEIFLIDKQNHHLFQPLLYQVATAALSPADIAVPLREILRDQSNTTCMMSEVVSIDKDNKKLVCKNGEVINYDYLVIAAGARHSYFGNDGWESFAPGLKTIKDAIGIREKILLSFEKAERLDSISEASKYLNFVIIGAGPTGVELAGAIAEITHKTMFKNFRRIDPSKSKIYLIEGAPRILPPYPPVLSKKAQTTLEKMGIKVLTSTIVTEVTKDGVKYGDEFIEARNVIWAAGNQASPLLKTLDTELDRAGRAIVDADLSLPNYPNIFVIGDAACAKGKNDVPLPAIAPVAIQQARFVAKIIKKQTPKEKRNKFKYLDKGSMATIGTNKAVGNFKGVKFTGVLAWLAWGFVHVAFLVGFKNRMSIIMQWVIHYITGMRGARLIHNPIDDTPKPPENDTQEKK